MIRAVSKKLIISALLIVVAAGFLLVNECAYGGAMASSYKDCDCLGYEWEQYDQTPADGHKLAPSLLAQAMGKIGGSRTSSVKRKSSRENGKLGGRPKGKH